MWVSGAWSDGSLLWVYPLGLQNTLEFYFVESFGLFAIRCCIMTAIIIVLIIIIILVSIFLTTRICDPARVMWWWKLLKLYGEILISVPINDGYFSRATLLRWEGLCIYLPRKTTLTGALKSMLLVGRPMADRLKDRERTKSSPKNVNMIRSNNEGHTASPVAMP